jgi:hypothetical protein
LLDKHSSFVSWLRAPSARFIRLGLEFVEPTAENAARLVWPVLCAVYSGQEQSALRIVRIHRNGLFKGRDCCSRVSLREADQAQHAKRCRGLSREANRVLRCHLGGGQAAFLKMGHGQQAQ